MPCAIVPPHVLEALARSDDPRVRERALATLAHDLERHARALRRDAAGSGRRLRRPATGSLDEPSRSIHDAQHATALPGVLVRAEGAPASGDRAVDEAYDGLGATWELWHAAYGRRSLDDKGMGLVASVHFDRHYDNAFWDGQQMVFGDGDGTVFVGFTRAIDVIGHELAHGVTQFTSGLNYQDQSGALNEHVSDVFGVLVKQRELGQSAEQADWLVGAGIFGPSVKGVGLRSMKEPGTAYDDPRLGRDPQPGHMRDYVDTTDDNGGVHINSGIPNKAFYLAATQIGGHAWEVAGQIWVDTITGDIRADCDFETFARLTLAAAERRHGTGSAEVAAVAAGWAGVGVPTGSASTPQTPAPSTPRAPGSGSGGSGSDAERVVVRRTGGIAGLVTEREVDLGALPHAQAQAWRGVLADPERLRAAAERGHGRPDAYTYRVHQPSTGLDVRLPEPGLDEHTRELLERTLRDQPG